MVYDKTSDEHVSFPNKDFSKKFNQRNKYKHIRSEKM